MPAVNRIKDSSSINAGDGKSKTLAKIDNIFTAKLMCHSSLLLRPFCRYLSWHCRHFERRCCPTRFRVGRWQNIKNVISKLLLPSWLSSLLLLLLILLWFSLTSWCYAVVIGASSSASWQQRLPVLAEPLSEPQAYVRRTMDSGKVKISLLSVTSALNRYMNMYCRGVVLQLS